MSPKIAIIDANTLAVIGLRQLLQGAMPHMTIDCFGTLAELLGSDADSYYHYFASMDVVLTNRAFFTQRCRKTIVLTLSLSDTSQLTGFHSLCINQPEPILLRQLLNLQQHGHSQRQTPITHSPTPLTDREIEVMSLIVQGLINKEIADRLHISLSTAITHRRNIMNKLSLRSVSALTVYAVTHGYVDINKI